MSSRLSNRIAKLEGPKHGLKPITMVMVNVVSLVSSHSRERRSEPYLANILSNGALPGTQLFKDSTESEDDFLKRVEAEHVRIHGRPPDE